MRNDSIAYFNQQADIAVQKNNYKKALTYTQNAVQIAAATKDSSALAQQSFKLGKLFYDLKKYSDALASFQKSRNLHTLLPPSLAAADVEYYLVLTYLAKSNLKKARKHQEQFVQLQKATGHFDKSCRGTLQEAILLLTEKKVKQASVLFLQIINQPDSPEIIASKAASLYRMGWIENENKKYNLAINYLQRALKLSEQSDLLDLKCSVLLALSNSYSNILDQNNAYVYLKAHLNLKEYLTTITNQRLGIDEYTAFKEAEKNKEIHALSTQTKTQQKANKFSKLISILAIALISILSLLSLSLYKNNIIRNQSNLLLKEKNNELEIAKDKAEKASQARAEFLSTVSHELRTPLNAINGITHLLLQENPKKSQIDYLSSLKFSGDYLTKFINEILEINKIESHNLELEQIPFHLKQLLVNIKHSLKELAIVNNNEFSLEINEKIPDYLIGDPTKLSQIILNLINNALKFTSDGVIYVRVNLEKIENKIAFISFEITDTGIGIPEDKLESVFDSFSQGSTEVNRKYGGTGLGLTIVKKLTETLGGQIQLQSKINQGSTFSFSLSFLVAEKPTQQIEHDNGNQTALLAHKKILLVEDNKINQMITRKMLHNKQITCEVIDNGEEAIELMRFSKFDMVLMDVHLPGINGTVATQTIREFDTTTPIIALTAISLHENRDMLLSFGMNDVITKPFIPAEFYDTIAAHLLS
ncbi:MAG: ATP-binding protein [Flavobacterium sp.]